MRKLLMSAVALLLLLVGADVALRYYAGNQIAEALTSRLGLTQAPAVTLSGFPFVLEAATGSYDVITVTLPPQRLGSVDGVGVTMDLVGLRLPLGNALAGNLDGVSADSTQARITVPTGSLAIAANVPGLTFSSEGGQLAAGATVTVFGTSYAVTAPLTLTVDADAITVTSEAVSGVGAELSTAVQQAIGTLVAVTVPLTGLPFTVEHASVTLVGSDLVIDSVATGLQLGTS